MKDEQLTISSRDLQDLDKFFLNFISCCSYSIGALLGDGYMTYIYNPNGNYYITELRSLDYEMPLRFMKEVNSMFLDSKQITQVMMGGKSGRLIRYCRSDIFKTFYYSTNGKSEVPIWVTRSDKQSKVNFIAGIFDAEGSVKFTETWNGTKTKKNPRWQLGFSNSKLNIVESVQAILQSLGVITGAITTYKKKGCLTIYSIYPNIKSFINVGCYFEIHRKQDRLIDYLDHVTGSETKRSTS